MGLRNAFRRFISKVKELLGIYDKYNDFEATAFFSNGGEAKYIGKPWGSAFEQFKELALDAYQVKMNMTAYKHIHSYRCFNYNGNRSNGSDRYSVKVQ